MPVTPYDDPEYDAFVRWAEEYLPEDVDSDSLEAWDLFEVHYADKAEMAAERRAEARKEARGR
jgi:hypothetical protein